MDVYGNITLSEGGVINNLTLPNGTAFPANGNLGQKFYLTEPIDGNTPKGEYSHNGTTWVHKPTRAQIKQMLADKAAPKSYKTIGVCNVSHNLGPAGNSVFTNRAVVRIANGMPVDKPLPGIWIDPADYPAGTKLKIHIHLSVNNMASSTAWPLSMRKVTRPASSGGAAALVTYTLDATLLGTVVFTSPHAALAEKDVESAEFDMPSTAGLYAFAYTQSAPNAAGSVHQMTASLKAYY